jgi:hypothetical protein
MHVTLEELVQDSSLMMVLHRMVRQAGRDCRTDDG